MQNWRNLKPSMYLSRQGMRCEGPKGATVSRGVLTYRLDASRGAAAAGWRPPRPPPPPRTAEAAPCANVPPLPTPHMLQTDSVRRTCHGCRGRYVPESGAAPGRGTLCPPPMLFGLRLRVWMPSFFMLSGRFTCTETHDQTVSSYNRTRAARLSDFTDGETPRNLPPCGPIIL